MRQREKELEWRERQLTLREQSVKEAEVSLSASTEQVCPVLTLTWIVKMQFRIEQ